MFSLILTAVATLMHGYLAWRITTLPWFSHGQRRRNARLFALLLWLLYSAAIQLRHGSDGGLMATVEQFALDWLGILFIATTTMLSLELLTGFGAWFKPRLERLRLSALVVAGLLVIVAFIQGSRPPVVVHHEVAITGLPAELNGTRLVVLSDLHLGSQLGAAWLAKRVQQVRQLEPDIIVLLGDIFEGHGKPSPELPPLFAQLKAPLGVYAVTGNHEFHGDSNTAIAMSEQAGVEWLRNRTKQVAPGLLLAGVDDLSQHLRNGNSEDQITPLLGKRPSGATILLSHSPLQVTQAAAAGTTLMLCGHTHGGQIWPFSYLVGHFYPYLAGRYQIRQMTLIVSRGTGLWGPRMRLWYPGEIIEVTLKK